MQLYYLVLFSLVNAVSVFAQSNCAPTEATVVIDLQFDDYPSETAWELRDATGAIYAQSPQYPQGSADVRDTLCVPAATCLAFTITDQYNDGMCCGFGEGSYTLYVDGEMIAAGGDFGSVATHYFNCPPGSTCDSAIPLYGDTSAVTADHAWFQFQPWAAGNYALSTCDFDNTCPSNIWLYDACTSLGNDPTNLGTIFFNAGACGDQSALLAGLDSTRTYYLRIGSAAGCTQDSVGWELSYEGPITGCTDPLACTYNPLASVDDGSCVYPGDPACPDGPDLALDEASFVSSLALDVLTNTDDCMIQEGCLGGYGERQLLRFDTRILNVGNQDYYIGQPPVDLSTPDPAWEWDLCHQHWHYEGYAEYLVYDPDGNELPLGFKNGFCVMDIECSGGGTAKFSCSDQGISAGCGDIYDAYLPCQWFDITDLAAGTYTFVVRTNWNQAPDALGRQELSYANNWMQACLNITRDSVTNQVGFSLADSCELYVDCAGEVLGSAVPDCAGDCDGTRLTGDLNQDAARDQADIFAYFDRVLSAAAAPTACEDLDADGRWTVADLALLIECSLHAGQPSLPGHAHSPCEFPFAITNPADTVRYSILAVDAAQGYADLAIHPQSVPLAGFQLTLSGAAITGVTSNTDDFDADWRHNANIIVAASLSEDVLEKSTAPRPLCRVYFAPADTVTLCLEEAISINAVRERTVSVRGDCRTDALTSTDELPGAEASLTVYPNPADAEVYVLFDNPQGRSLDARLFDAAGRVVATTRTRASSWRIPTALLAEGVYHVRLTDGNAARYGRVVVSH